MLKNYAKKQDDSYCCCEYRSVNGERSHILEVCCNCEVLDETFDRLITCRTLPSNACSKIMLRVTDRMRFPWCDSHGARKVDPETLLATLTMPFTMFIAAQGWPWTFLIFFSLLISYICFCVKKCRFGPHPKFFFSWAVTSFIFLLLVFEFEVVAYLEILFVENFVLMCFVSIMCFSAYLTKLHCNAAINSLKYICNDRSSLSITMVEQEQWPKCENCNLFQSPQTSHCRLCGFCIQRRDHHFVWLNTCIGATNHRFFIIGLASLVAACVYGGILTLTTVCHPFLFAELFLLPDDCSDVFGDIHISICFVCSLYALMLAGFCTLVLLQQTWLVCHNTTHREWKNGQLGLYSKGVVKNIYEFCFGYQ